MNYFLNLKNLTMIIYQKSFFKIIFIYLLKFKYFLNFEVNDIFIMNFVIKFLIK